MADVRMEIDKDPSGITYGYNIYLNDELYMSGDAYTSPEALKNDLREVADVISQALKSED